jgi:hypothetical protein
MRYARIALLTATITLLPLACSSVEVTAGPAAAETDTATAPNIRHVRHARLAAPARAATLAPQPNGIRSVAHVCAWDALDWDELYDPEKRAFETLGWSRDNWNSDNETTSSSKGWFELTRNERNAAQALGFNEANWDVSCPNDIPD